MEASLLTPDMGRFSRPQLEVVPEAAPKTDTRQWRIGQVIISGGIARKSQLIPRLTEAMMAEYREMHASGLGTNELVELGRKLRERAPDTLWANAHRDTQTNQAAINQVPKLGAYSLGPIEAREMAAKNSEPRQ